MVLGHWSVRHLDQRRFILEAMGYPPVRQHQLIGCYRISNQI